MAELAPPAANLEAAMCFMATAAAAGVRDVVLSPGSRSTPLVLAAAASERVQVHTILDERAAAFAALAMGRATGMPALLIRTSGTAAAHDLPAVCEASAAGVPLLVLSANRPVEQWHAGASQTMPQSALFGAHARAFFQLDAPGPGVPPRHAASVALQAVATACGLGGGRPGAVHIDAPFREPLTPDEATPAKVGKPPQLFLTLPEALAVTQRPDTQRPDTQHIAVLVGDGVCSGDTPGLAAAVDAAMAAGIPVLAEPSSGWLGHTRALGQAPALIDVLAARDLAPQTIVQLGAAPLERRTRGWLASLPMGRHVLADRHARWRDPGHRAAGLWVADEVEVLSAVATHFADTDTNQGPKRPPKTFVGRDSLNELSDSGPAADDDTASHVTDTGRSAWAKTVAQTAAALQDATRAAFHNRSAPAATATPAATPAATLTASGAAVVSTSVAAAAAHQAALHLASSLPIRDACWHPGPWPAAPVFAQRGVAGIDGLASGVWGEAHALGRPILALSGDLSALHDLSGLRLLAEQPPASGAALVIIDNGGGGIFDLLPSARHEAHPTHFRTPPVSDVAAVCHGLGLATERFDLRADGRLAQLRSAIDETLSGELTRALVVRVHPDERAVHEALRALAAEVANAGAGSR